MEVIPVGSIAIFCNSYLAILIVALFAVKSIFFALNVLGRE